MIDVSQNYILKTRLTEIVDLERITRGVNMGITQLDAGSFESDVVQLKVRNVLASLITSNRRLRIRGTVNFLTLSFACVTSGQPSWRGIPVESGDVLAANAGDEFDLVVPAGVESYCVSVIGTAEVTLRNLGGPVLANKLHDTAHPIPCDTDAVRKIERWLPGQFDDFGGDSQIANGLALDLEQGYLRRLAECMRAGSASSGNGYSSHSQRNDVVKCVEEHLLSDIAIPQTVDDLCRVAGTSRRTLEYAFADYFGTSPKRFLKALRLNAARNELLKGSYGFVQVSEVALGWGFTHMGQFASDFRQMFGENPSETLRKVSP